MSARFVLALSLLTFAGCDDKAPAPTPSVPAPTTTATPPAPAPAPTATAKPAAAELPDKAVPVTADYAGAVRKDITKSNYKAELDKLEKELAK